MLGLRNRDNGNGDVRPEVRDVQDDFLNIYRRVYDKEKSWAKRFTEEAAPQTQKDFSVIQSIETKKDFLLKKLEDKLGDIKSVGRDNDDDLTGYPITFGNSYDIIQPYNEIIRMYLNPDNNSKTKEEIKSKIQEIGPIVNQIISIANSTFKSLFFPPYGFESDQRIKKGNKYLTPMITTYIALLLIQKNLFRGTYSTINKPQLDVQYKEWLSYLTDDERAFMKTIENPSGASEALIERQRLIEEDRGYPLSAVERLNLRNSMFGISSNKQYSPAELAELEAEDRRDAAAYRVYREGLADNRGLFGVERADLMEEAKLGQEDEAIDEDEGGDEAKVETEDEDEDEGEAKVEPEDEPAAAAAGEPAAAAAAEPVANPDRMDRVRFDEFMRQTITTFNEYLEKYLTPSRNLTASAGAQQEKIMKAIGFLIGSYRDGYIIINKRIPSLEEEQRFIDGAINSQTDSNGELNLTEESVRRGNPRNTEQKRTDLYRSLLMALNFTVYNANYGIMNYMENVRGGEPDFLDESEKETDSDEFNSIKENVKKQFNKFLENYLAPYRNAKAKENKQQDLIKDAIRMLIEYYIRIFTFLNGVNPSASETQQFIDNVINTQVDSSGNRNLTAESINKGNPRSTKQKRTDIYQSLLNVLEYVINIGGIYGLGRPKMRKPRARPQYKVSQALHYDGARNDPYLIR
jgi:hypothetical protein